MNTDTVLVAGLLIAGFALISGPIKASPVTPAMIFVIVGLLVGPDVLGIFDLGAGVSGFKALAELALTLLLFLQASRLDFREVKANLPRRLVFVGLPLTIAVGTLGALLIFPELSFWEAACWRSSSPRSRRRWSRNWSATGAFRGRSGVRSPSRAG